MFKTIAPSIIEDIRQRTDIVDTVGQFVALKRSGSNYKGLCPFHSEKTPSFMVNPTRQSYKCFGCGAGGNVITFLMQQNQQSFPEVIKELASQHGIYLEWSEQDDGERDLKATIKRINEAACAYFEANLADPELGQAARAYLHQRGITEATQRHFRLGFALNSWHALEHHLKKMGFSEADLLASGLFREPESKTGMYDLFRDRLMFPILSAIDEVVGFGGRLMSQEKVAKYINSPETALYQKGHHVYGLNHAKKTIRERGHALLVEGYLDVITAHQFGFEQAVAGLGTALTPQQARQIIRYSDHKQVLIAYDADEAGQKATERASEVLNELNVQARVQVVVMPEDMDPDTFLQSFGSDSFQALLDIAVPAFEYQIEKILQVFDLNHSQQKSDAAKAAIELLLKIKEPVYRDECLQWASQMLGVELNILREQFVLTKRKMARYQKQRYPQKKAASPKGPAAPEPLGAPKKIRSSEMGLLYLFVTHPESRPEIAELFDEVTFSDALSETLRQDLLALHQEGVLSNEPQLMDYYSEPAMHQHISDILENEKFEPPTQENPTAAYEKLLADFSRNVKLQCLSVKLDQLNQEIKEAEKQQSQEDFAQLMQVYMTTVKDLNDLKSQNF